MLMLRGGRLVCRRFQPFSQQFRFISTTDEKKLELLEEIRKTRATFEVKRIAEVVQNSAEQFKKQLNNWENNHSKINGKHLIGSVPMPLELVRRLSEEEIASSTINDTTTFNFVIRKHYPEIYKKCKTERNGIIGTPGIAKSVSLLYPLLDHIANKSPDTPVVLHSGEDAHVFVDGSCWTIFDFMDSTRIMKSCLKRYPELLYLVDGPAGIKSHLDIRGRGAKTILASSPGKQNYHEFLKQGFRFMMPCWSLEELLEARELVNPDVTEQMVIDRYEKVGGVIRGVLTSQGKADAYFKLVKDALDTEKDSPNNMILKVDIEDGLQTSDIGGRGVFSHRIYHFEVDPITFETTKVIFASQWVKSNLDRIRLNKLKKEYIEAKVSKSGYEIGGLYETYVYTSWCVATESMENIADSKVVNDETKNVKIWKQITDISTAEKFCEYVNELFHEKIDKEGTFISLIKPKSQTFPAIDFAVYNHSTKKLRLVQTTTNNDKKLSVNNLMKFNDLSTIKGLSVQFLIVTDQKDLARRGSGVRWEKLTDDMQQKKAEIEKWLVFDAILFGEEFWRVSFQKSVSSAKIFLQQLLSQIKKN